MSIQRTLSIIKPDAVSQNHIGVIIARFEEEGLRIAASRMVHLSRRDAEGFYAVHSERPFFGELTEFMSSGPAVLLVLEGENAIGRSWGPPTRRKPLPVPFGPCTPRISVRMRSMARMRPRQPLLRLPTSSAAPT